MERLYYSLLDKTEQKKIKWRAIGPTSFGLMIGGYRFLIYPTGWNLANTHITIYEGDLFFAGIYCPDNRLYEFIKENTLSYPEALADLTIAIEAL